MAGDLHQAVVLAAHHNKLKRFQQRADLIDKQLTAMAGEEVQPGVGEEAEFAVTSPGGKGAAPGMSGAGALGGTTTSDADMEDIRVARCVARGWLGGDAGRRALQQGCLLRARF